MTHPAPKKLPYDEWFDDNPLADTKYIEEKPKVLPVTIHEEMYRFATLRVGGSEFVHSVDKT